MNYIKPIITMAVFALAVYGGVNAYERSYAKCANSDDSILMQNIEALSNGEGNEGISQYINVTDKTTTYNHKTITVHKDSTDTIINYVQACLHYYTYCKYTATISDHCHPELNGLVVSCGEWTME